MDDKIKKVCDELVQLAGTKALEYFKSDLRISQKADKSYVTNADTSIEHELRSILKKEFPDHNIHGEEEGRSDKGSPYTWYIDPIDGTSNFLFGIPLFGSAIAVTKYNEIITSSIYLPALNIKVTASKAKGLFINGVVFKNTGISKLENTTLLIDSGKSLEAKLDTAKFLKENIKKFRSLRQLGSVASDCVLLASDNLNVSMIISAPSHDLFPLALIYKEAGLSLLDRFGEDWNTNSSDLIACKPELAQEMKSALNAVFSK